MNTWGKTIAPPEVPDLYQRQDNELSAAAITGFSLNLLEEIVALVIH